MDTTANAPALRTIATIMRAVNALSDVMVAVEVGIAVEVGAAVDALADALADADADALALALALTEGATLLLDAATEELLAATELLLDAAALEEEAAAELLEEAGVAGISVEFSVPKYLGTGISPFITHSPLRGASFSRSLVAARDLTTPVTTDPFLTSEGLSAEAPFKPKQLVNTHSLAAAKEEEPMVKVIA